MSGKASGKVKNTRQAPGSPARNTTLLRQGSNKMIRPTLSAAEIARRARQSEKDKASSNGTKFTEKRNMMKMEMSLAPEDAVAMVKQGLKIGNERSKSTCNGDAVVFMLIDAKAIERMITGVLMESTIQTEPWQAHYLEFRNFQVRVTSKEAFGFLHLSTYDGADHLMSRDSCSVAAGTSSSLNVRVPYLGLDSKDEVVLEYVGDKASFLLEVIVAYRVVSK